MVTMEDLDTGADVCIRERERYGAQLRFELFIRKTRNVEPAVEELQVRYRVNPIVPFVAWDQLALFIVIAIRRVRPIDRRQSS